MPPGKAAAGRGVISMLHNLGLSEFLVLATLALLFFGPERLPQIAAQIGRWLARLRQYSRAFMTEWSDESLVLREAMAEVKSIRDEILAAQTELATTLDSVRRDAEEGVHVAQEALSAAQIDLRQPPQQPAGIARPEVPPLSPPAPGKAATVRSQQILDRSPREPVSAGQALLPPAAGASAEAELAQLNDQVARMEDEFRALCQELERLRSEIGPHQEPTGHAGGEEAAEQAPSTEPSVAALPLAAPAGKPA
jgi:sec-independent protein translocase protein TatB